MPRGATTSAGSASVVVAAMAALAAPAVAQDAPDAPEPATAEQAEPAEPFDVPVHGSLMMRYLLRTTSDDSDQDLYGFLGVDVGEPERRGFTGRVLTKAAWDVDGDVGTTGASTFHSLEDTYDRRLTAQLYEGYVDWHGAESLEVARLGRQILSETPVQTYFDGLRVDTGPHDSTGWKLGAYGGVPSHLYESSPEGDLIFGAFGEAKPLDSTRARLDWMQVQDDYLSADRLNALVRLAVWQQLGESLAMYGSYSLLDWQGRDLEVRGTWSQVEGDAQVEIGYFHLLTTQRAESIEFDPYFDIAGEYNPYRELRASASKGFGDHWSVAVGADVRRLVDDGDEGDFNHDFERWYLGPALSDWPVKGMTTTVTGELWDDGDETITAADANVTQEFSKDTKAYAGTSYSLYKYDYLTATERDDVTTYYVGLDTRATKHVRLRFDYVYEIDEFDHYNTFRVAATWSF